MVCIFDRIPDFPYPNPIVRRSDDQELPQLYITFEMYIDSKTIVEKTILNDRSDFVQNCIDNAEAAFRFEMTIPDPFPPDDHMNPSSPMAAKSQAAIAKQSKLLEGELTSAVMHTCKVEGVLFYYPFTEGVEKRPYAGQIKAKANTPSGLETRDDGAVVEYISDDDDGSPSASATSNTNAQQVFRDNDPTFTIYWQDRLVPQSSVMRLPCFPDLITLAQCNSESIAFKWMNRVKGFLFFDWNFRHISNNKLKIQIPDINQWLNDKQRIKDITFKPTGTNAIFKKFLQKCHEHLDREFQYDTRDIEL